MNYYVIILTFILLNLPHAAQFSFNSETQKTYPLGVNIPGGGHLDRSKLICSNYKHNPSKIEELRIRDGLPNVFYKLNKNQALTVAYLGGSITKAKGWRNETFAWLEQEYPRSTFKHINAGISGTPADFGAMRLKRDILNYNVDLLIIEFRVNSGGGIGTRAIEGIIRQVWDKNPTTDICLVYTISNWMLSHMVKENTQTHFGEEMETVANYYGIPSIDLAPEVIKQLKEGKLEFEAEEPVPGKLHFSVDGVHPTTQGHKLYTDVINRSLTKMKNKCTPNVHELQAPLVENHLINAELISITNAKTSEGWEVVNMKKDSIYLTYDNGRRSPLVLGKAIKTNQEGTAYTINWLGTRLTLSSIQQQGMEISVTTDGRTPVFYTYNRTNNQMAARLTNLNELPNGKHSTTITVQKVPKGTWFYAGQYGVLHPPKS
jgi:hypothetical protein